MIKRNTIGCFERVHFPDFGELSRIAKIDTGAFSGSIHVSNIAEKGRSLSFNLFGKKKYCTTVKKYKKTSFKAANGLRERRYMAYFNIEINGQAYEILLGLADRSEMKRGLLIGRRFLKQNNFIIDVNLHNEFDMEWKMKGDRK